MLGHLAHHFCVGCAAWKCHGTDCGLRSPPAEQTRPLACNHGRKSRPPTQSVSLAKVTPRPRSTRKRITNTHCLANHGTSSSNEAGIIFRPAVSQGQLAASAAQHGATRLYRSRSPIEGRNGHKDVLWPPVMMVSPTVRVTTKLYACPFVTATGKAPRDQTSSAGTALH